ncbi:MAG: YbjN domain-containing protein [Deltaproteobacteria bacterium]|nr:YbjN domain-containing protein [Deltaproteobacteria bacterium]
MPETRTQAAPAAIVALAALLAASLHVLFPPELEAQSCQPVTILTLAALEKIMDAEDYDTDPLPGVARGHGFLWKIPGTVSSLRIGEGGGSLHFYAPYQEGGAGFEKVNSWNRDFYFARSYIDDEGDPGLYMDLSLEGGICQERIRNFLTTCLEADQRWREHMSE